MQLTIPKLRTWHLLGIVAASAAILAALQVRWTAEDPGYALIRRLRSVDADERAKAARELVWLRPRERRAIAPLTEMLFDPDARARASAARALLGVIDRADEEDCGQARAALTSALGDHDPAARLEIAKSLCSLNPEPKVIVPTLIELARDPWAPNRVKAVDLLRLHARRSDPAVAALLDSLEDPDPEVRAGSASSLGFSSWLPSVAPRPFLERIKSALAGVADDDDARVRAAAVEALGSIAARSRFDDPRVIRALGDPSSLVRYSAAGSLYWHRPGRRSGDLIPALVRALGDADWQVRFRSAGTLGALGLEGEVALNSLRASTGDPMETVREEATKAVSAIEEAARTLRTVTLPGALADLGDADPNVRALAAVRLEGIGPRAAEAVPALVVCLADREADVRRASASALGQLGPGAVVAVPTLTKLAEADPDERVRQAARLSRSTLLGKASVEDRAP